ncbi:MAG TPA: hypothetical protein VFV67_12910 [Actinophytocola sp.]|uniref:hypothetical protein n=1 Tax=Actinophytocola sp. TaxID=1872138 RepID=UPI002DBEBB5C|nr:hypothetical protein [Actinophytocola sp.]HEU5471546.1 hypothetical protein [Actinophytocola sp.]
MLYLVLILVIAAFALLIAALTTAVTVWAWASVVISVVAAGLLVFDWLRGRRRLAATSAPRRAEDNGLPPTRSAAPPPVELTSFIDPLDRLAHQPDRATEPPPGEGPEPGEEPTDAADLLIVAALDSEVRVVDEHPRYHLADCTWLPGKSTIPLPVSEARELGFTPCARCTPDTTLAAHHRNTRQPNR